jgi:predicted Zn-dependent protease
VDYQTTREQAGWIADITGNHRSHGCSYAQNWSDVQFQRMPNVSLLPGEEDIGLDEVIGSVERGIYIKAFHRGGRCGFPRKPGRRTGSCSAADRSRTRW